MKKISEMLNWFRDEVTGIEEVTNLLPELDAIIREAEKRENYTQSDVCDKLQAAISDAGIAYNPYDKGWNAAIRFAIAELELSNNQDEAGAAWQQSRLLEDKGLAEKVAWAITNADMEFRSTATIPHWARHLTQAAIAEIKKHLEGV